MARLRLVLGQTSWWVVRVGSVTWLRPFVGPAGAEHRWVGEAEELSGGGTGFQQRTWRAGWRRR